MLYQALWIKRKMMENQPSCKGMRLSLILPHFCPEDLVSQKHLVSDWAAGYQIFKPTVVQKIFSRIFFFFIALTGKNQILVIKLQASVWKPEMMSNKTKSISGPHLSYFLSTKVMALLGAPSVWKQADMLRCEDRGRKQGQQEASVWGQVPGQLNRCHRPGEKLCLTTQPADQPWCRTGQLSKHELEKEQSDREDMKTSPPSPITPRSFLHTHLLCGQESVDPWTANTAGFMQGTRWGGILRPPLFFTGCWSTLSSRCHLWAQTTQTTLISKGYSQGGVKGSPIPPSAGLGVACWRESLVWGTAQCCSADATDTAGIGLVLKMKQVTFHQLFVVR